MQDCIRFRNVKISGLKDYPKEIEMNFFNDLKDTFPFDTNNVEAIVVDDNKINAAIIQSLVIFSRFSADPFALSDPAFIKQLNRLLNPNLYAFKFSITILNHVGTTIPEEYTYNYFTYNFMLRKNYRGDYVVGYQEMIQYEEGTDPLDNKIKYHIDIQGTTFKTNNSNFFMSTDKTLLESLSIYLLLRPATEDFQDLIDMLNRGDSDANLEMNIIENYTASEFQLRSSEANLYFELIHVVNSIYIQLEDLYEYTDVVTRVGNKKLLKDVAILLEIAQYINPSILDIEIVSNSIDENHCMISYLFVYADRKVRIEDETLENRKIFELGRFTSATHKGNVVIVENIDKIISLKQLEWLIAYISENFAGQLIFTVTDLSNIDLSDAHVDRINIYNSKINIERTRSKPRILN